MLSSRLAGFVFEGVFVLSSRLEGFVLEGVFVLGRDFVFCRDS